jgi:hypothetical protein
MVDRKLQRTTDQDYNAQRAVTLNMKNDNVILFNFITSRISQLFFVDVSPKTKNETLRVYAQFHHTMEQYS